MIPSCLRHTRYKLFPFYVSMQFTDLFHFYRSPYRKECQFLQSGNCILLFLEPLLYFILSVHFDPKLNDLCVHAFVFFMHFISRPKRIPTYNETMRSLSGHVIGLAYDCLWRCCMHKLTSIGTSTCTCINSFCISASGLWLCHDQFRLHISLFFVVVVVVAITP